MKTRNQFPTREGYKAYRRDYYNNIATNVFGWMLLAILVAMFTYAFLKATNFID